MSIDNPMDKVRDIADEKDDELFNGLILAGAVFSPIMAVVATVKGVFDGAERQARIWSAIRALCDELEAMRDRLPNDAEAALSSAWFKGAVQVVLEESARAVNQERAVMLSRAAAHGCFPDDENKHRQKDLANYIRDLAQLGADDIQMLKLLRDAYQEPIRTTPNMHDPNYFTEHFDEFKRMATDLNIHVDDRIALGARLSGFGLAYEAARNTTRQTPGEHCFRPTRRGVYLLSLLEAAEAPRGQQN
jgi:hypothetical protein